MNSVLHSLLSLDIIMQRIVCRLCYSIATYLLANVMKKLVCSYVYLKHLATDSEQTLKLYKFIICPAAQKVSEVTCSSKVARSS